MEQMDRLAQLWTVTLPMARRNFKLAKQKQIAGQNRRWLVGGPLMVGQVVYRRVHQPNSKLANQFEGPYRVVKRLAEGGGNYVLESPFGVRLAGASPRHMLKAVSHLNALPASEPDDAAPFEEVLGARQKDGAWQYLVRWSDREVSDPARDQWIPEGNFMSVDAMRAYRNLAALDAEPAQKTPALVASAVAGDAAAGAAVQVGAVMALMDVGEAAPGNVDGEAAPGDAGDEAAPGAAAAVAAPGDGVVSGDIT